MGACAALIAAHQTRGSANGGLRDKPSSLLDFVNWNSATLLPFVYSGFCEWRGGLTDRVTHVAKILGSLALYRGDLLIQPPQATPVFRPQFLPLLFPFVRWEHWGSESQSRVT